MKQKRVGSSKSKTKTQNTKQKQRTKNKKGFGEPIGQGKLEQMKQRVESSFPQWAHLCEEREAYSKRDQSSRGRLWI